MYDPVIGRWTIMDRFMEKYYSVSPYSYAAGNPVKLVDVNGDSLILQGDERQAAFEELVAMLGHEITFSMDSRGAIYGSPTEGVKPSRAAKRIMKAIKSTDILINIIAKNNKNTPNGKYYVGGAFGGNEVHPDGSVTATQYVNPEVLRTMSTAYGKPGQDMIHEITEAYEGAKISQRYGVGVGPAVSEDQYAMDFYNIVHSRAVPQSGVVNSKFYDRAGRIVEENSGDAVRGEFSIRPKGKKPFIFYKYP